MESLKVCRSAAHTDIVEKTVLLSNVMHDLMCTLTMLCFVDS